MRKKTFLLLISFSLVASHFRAQNYNWAKNIGSDLLSGQGITAYGMAADNNGSIYLAGSFDGTVDFDPGPGVAAITTAGSFDIFFAKYDAGGNYQWAKSIGSTMSDICFTMAVDGNGHVFLGGYYGDLTDFDPGSGIQNLNFTGGEDAFLARYDNNGNYLWAKSFGGTGVDAVYSLAIDGGGNIFAAGQFQLVVDFDPGPAVASMTAIGSPTSSNLFFARFDAAGNYLWAKQINTEYYPAIATDGNGNCYLTGSYAGTVDFDPGTGVNNLPYFGNEDIFIAAYDVNGNHLYAHGMGSTFNDAGSGIVADNGGNVYVTGHFGGSIDFDPGSGQNSLTATWNADIFLAKYNAGGNYGWANHFASDFPSVLSKPVALHNNDILLTGAFYGTSDFDPGPGVSNLVSVGNADIFFARFDNAGNYLSANSTGNAFSNDLGSSITVGGGGSILVMGLFTDSADFDPGPGTATLHSAIPFGQDVFFANYSSGPVFINNPATADAVLDVYPNPSDGEIHIVTEKNIPGGTLTLYNSLGEKTRSWIIENSQRETITFHEPPGLYFLLLNTDKNRQVRKILVR